MKILIVLALLVVAACAKVGPIVEDACAKEARAHSFYMTVIAPFRPADRVAKAVAFHTKVQDLCAKGAAAAAIAKASAEADAARN